MFHGVSVTACSVISFTVLLSLADFVLDEGGPDWLEGEDDFDDPQRFPDDEVDEEVTFIFYFHSILYFKRPYCCCVNRTTTEKTVRPAWPREIWPIDRPKTGNNFWD